MSIENLIPHQFKKVDPRTTAAARASHIAQRKHTSMRTILRKLALLPPSKIFALSKVDKDAAAALKKIGLKSVKDLVAWKLLHKAVGGNLKAIEMFLSHIGESPENNVTINSETQTVNVTLLKQMSLPELEKFKTKLLESKSDA